MAVDLEIFGDVAVSNKNSAIIVAMGLTDVERGLRSPYADCPAPTTMVFDGTPWSPWGNTHNMEPWYIADDIKNIGVLHGGLDAKANIANGKGIKPFLRTNIGGDGKEELEYVADSEIEEFLDRSNTYNYGYFGKYDSLAYGFRAGGLVMNLGRTKIDRVVRHDVYEVRLAKKDASTRRSMDLYLSAEWEKAGASFDKKLQEKIPLLQEGNEHDDLIEMLKKDAKSLEFGFVNRTLRNGEHYYPTPLYRSNRAWFKIARNVPASKIAMFKNSITTLRIFTIHPKFWEDRFGRETWAKYSIQEKTDKVNIYYNKINDWIGGVDNGYKSLFTGGFVEITTGKLVPYITVETLDDKVTDGKYLLESGAANVEILFPLMIQPALMGAGNPSGNAYGDTSGGSNIREAFLIQLMVTEPLRRETASIFKTISKFNGWNKRLERERTIVTPTGSRVAKDRLVWRHPSNLLTTLDTGKSTKAENL